jgi:hypothetical protein
MSIKWQVGATEMHRPFKCGVTARKFTNPVEVTLVLTKSTTVRDGNFVANEASAISLKEKQSRSEIFERVV